MVGSSIQTPTLDELLKNVPGWQGMPPAKAIAAVGKAEANDAVEEMTTAK